MYTRIICLILVTELFDSVHLLGIVEAVQHTAADRAGMPLHQAPKLRLTPLSLLALQAMSLPTMPILILGLDPMTLRLLPPPHHRMAILRQPLQLAHQRPSFLAMELMHQHQPALLHHIVVSLKLPLGVETMVEMMMARDMMKEHRALEFLWVSI